MRNVLPGLIVGTIFGAGLALSDMINPGRVLAFLDLAGAWDPTLAFVMVSALVPSAIGYAFARRMKRPVAAEAFAIPSSRAVEPRMLAGAIIFGIGWGLIGLCPGPAVANLAFGSWQTWLFVAAMVGGMAVHRLLPTR